MLIERLRERVDVRALGPYAAIALGALGLGVIIGQAIAAKLNASRTEVNT